MCSPIPYSQMSGFNPRSPCGERRPQPQAPGQGSPVSTHAPLAGSDSLLIVADRDRTFLPTLPLRGATRCWPCTGPGRRSFYPRSPCGERPSASSRYSGSRRFLPTLPLRGATHSGRVPPWVVILFLPTLPLRGATDERRNGAAKRSQFLPTLPLRGATHAGAHRHLPRAVSTHAPLAGSDPARIGCSCRTGGFYPRSPCGERPLPGPRPRRCPAGFNPRSPCGERHASQSVAPRLSRFQPTLPLRGATRDQGRQP